MIMTTFRTFISLSAALLLAGSTFVRAETAAVGPGLATVPAAGEVAPLTREQLLATLAQDLAGHFNLEGDLQLELIRAWAAPAKTAARWEINILEYPSAASASMMLRCRVLADGAPAADTTFMVRASLFREVWVARQPIALGESFTPEALETRRVDTFRDRDALPTAVGDASYAFSRAVPAGRLLTWRDVSRRPLVKKGAVVEVTALDGPLAITMKAVAMENGAQGETVTVRNQESRKDFSAQVVAENRVQVRF